MGYSFNRADVAFLSSVAGTAALAEVDRLKLIPATHLRDLERVRRDHGAWSAALVETVWLRRRAGTKLADPGQWLLTDDALQQATPTLVARHRAARLAGRAVHDVTCSIGAELVELARVCPAVTGSDLDDVRLAMAEHNSTRVRTGQSMQTSASRDAVARDGAANAPALPHGPVVSAPAAGRIPEARNVLLVKADALAPCSADTVVVADPARRAGGHRTHDPAKLQPPLSDLLAAYSGRDLAVKCAPGLDFDRLDWPGEIEVVSLDGAVREACLWSPGLAEPSVTRRATVLSSTDPPVTLTDADPNDIPERAAGEWIIDPDGAIVRAGLVRHYAAKYGLWQLDPRIAYLTGDRVPPGVRGFRIVDRLEFREKILRAELHRRDCGTLEILARGVRIDPDQLRRRLKPVGTRPYSLVIARMGRTPTAFLCTAAVG